jgi:hypothetical protein
VIELTSIDEIADWLDQRELYMEAHLIKRRQDEAEAEGPGPTTYLGLAVSAPEVGGRFGVRPMVTGSGPVPPALPGPAWCTKVVGDELPYGVNIDEVGAALGGAGGLAIAGENIADEPLRCVEVSEAPVSGSRKGDTHGGHRDRGEPRGSAPPTPPCVRVRTRRFEKLR